MFLKKMIENMTWCVIFSIQIWTSAPRHDSMDSISQYMEKYDFVWIFHFDKFCENDVSYQNCIVINVLVFFKHINQAQCITSYTSFFETK